MVKTMVAGHGVWMQERHPGMVAVWVQGRGTTAVISAIDLSWKEALRHARALIADAMADQMGYERTSFRDLYRKSLDRLPILEKDLPVKLDWPLASVGTRQEAQVAYMRLVVAAIDRLLGPLEGEDE